MGWRMGGTYAEEEEGDEGDGVGGEAPGEAAGFGVVDHVAWRVCGRVFWVI